jgi:hypothetical protein
MENKQAVAVAVGVGAVGTALAYLGYSVYNKNDDTKNLVEDENKSWIGSLWTNSNKEETLPEKIQEETKEETKEETPEEPSKTGLDDIIKGPSDIQTAFSAFWKKEHKEIKKEEIKKDAEK